MDPNARRVLRSASIVALGTLLLMSLVASGVPRLDAADAHPKMPTSLQLLAMEAQASPQRLTEAASELGIDLDDGEVTVIVEPQYGRSRRVDELAVEALGGEVEATSESLLQVRIPADRLLDLADRVSGVAYIREPYQPRPFAVTSQGVALTGASDFHDAGHRGQGAKVAVIDLGFIGSTAAYAAGELDGAADGRCLDWRDGSTPGVGFAEIEAVMNHGTRVAEVVADMAPDATLYLMLISTSVDLQNAVSYCVTNDIDVINHSVGWFNSNFYDGTGFIAGLASTARANGILWCNSAGNDGDDGHWQGEYVDAGNGNLDFLDGAGVDDRNGAYASAGDELRVFLTWDDWADRDQNFDLYLYDSSGAQVAQSENLQTGWQQPTERILYDVPTSGTYYIAIGRTSATAPYPELEFFTYRVSGYGTSLEYHVPESSIIAPGNSEDVLTVGAIYHGNWETGPQEDFSSQGPTNDSVYAPSITKPDITGPDGTANYTQGPFYGTSSSSPHVEGRHLRFWTPESDSLPGHHVQRLLEVRGRVWDDGDGRFGERERRDVGRRVPSDRRERGRKRRRGIRRGRRLRRGADECESGRERVVHDRSLGEAEREELALPGRTREQRLPVRAVAEGCGRHVLLGLGLARWCRLRDQRPGIDRGRDLAPRGRGVRVRSGGTLLRRRGGSGDSERRDERPECEWGTPDRAEHGVRWVVR